MKRLLFDIEVSLGKAYIFRAGYNINVPAFHLFEEPKIICIAYKWEGQNKTYVLDWGKKQDDKEMLQKFVRIAESADEIIGHNSDRFDVKWIRTRCYFYNIPMMPEFTSVDTYKEAKKGFYFQSNGLDYINKYGGGKGKMHTDFDLWVKTGNGNKQALTNMKKYCAADVDRLEEVYKKMKPYIKHKSSVAQYKCDCPSCGSNHVGVKANKISAAGIKFKQMQCKECGQYFKLTESQERRAEKLKKLDAR